MADLPTNIVPGVTTGHATDHAALAQYLNNQVGFDEGQSILSHIGFPGDATQFLAGDGAFRVPAGGGGGGTPGFTTAMGWQFVRASGGNNANDGTSPLSAKATIQAAHDALPSGGGRIWLSEGTHNISAQQNITKRGVAIIGTGRASTILKCITNGIHMIHWTGRDGFAGNFAISDGSAGDFAAPMVGRGLSGIWVDDAQEFMALDLRFDNFGMGAATGLNFDSGPAGIRMVCTTGFGDWHHIYKCDFRQCYRGLALSSGNNGYVHGCNFYSGGENRVMGEKRTATGGNDCEFHFNQCTFAGSGNVNRFAVTIDHTASSGNRMGWSFVDCVMEISTATEALGGWYVNATEILFDDIVMSGGAKPYVRCGPDASGVRFGRFYGPTPRVEVPTGNTGAMRIWQPTDDSGTTANGAIATI